MYKYIPGSMLENATGGQGKMITFKKTETKVTEFTLLKSDGNASIALTPVTEDDLAAAGYVRLPKPCGLNYVAERASYSRACEYRGSLEFRFKSEKEMHEWAALVKAARHA